MFTRTLGTLKYTTLALALALTGAASAGSSTLTQEWAKQFGTSVNDFGGAVSTDRMGNVYVGGSLDGDGFVSKYNTQGELLWTKQQGNNGSVEGTFTENLGNVYVTGCTYGNLGGINQGKADAFIAKYDTQGSLLWTKQLGGNQQDFGRGVSADNLGNVYITGMTYGNLGGVNQGGHDAFVAKYSIQGDLLWAKQLGTGKGDYGDAITTDSLGNIFITGYEMYERGVSKTKGFVAKYNAQGDLLWTKQIGGESSGGGGASVDSLGNAYVTGNLDGDAFIAKYNTQGDLLWTKRLGSSTWDSSQGISIDHQDNLYIAGTTYGDLDGASQGRSDIFIVKYNTQGGLLWTKQLGSSGYDTNRGISADNFGNLYIIGKNGGDLAVTHQGQGNAFLIKFSDSQVPEPTSLLLLALLLLAMNRRKK